MTADFITSNKDSLRGEPKKRGREGRGGEALSPNQPLLISFPSPLLSTPATEATIRRVCVFQNMG